MNVITLLRWETTLIILSIVLLLTYGCSTNQILSKANESELVNDHLYQEYSIFDTCSGEILFEKINFVIEHESVNNLEDYELLIRSNGLIVYKGNYSNNLLVDFEICKGKQYNVSYDFTIFLVDKKNQVFYDWHRKDSYTLSEMKFNRIDIILFDQKNFDSSNSIEYSMDFVE